MRASRIALAILLAVAFAMAQSNSTAPVNGTSSGNSSVPALAQPFINLANQVIQYVELGIAIAFWGAVVIIAFHSIMAMLNPTRYGRIGELMNAVERGKDVLFAIFGIVLLLMIIFTALDALGYGVPATTAAINAAKTLLVDPITNLFHI
jgi:hypothetical protein|nr:MAG: hypothetical protein TU35_06450 [Thermoproteus sp. AZ2]